MILFTTMPPLTDAAIWLNGRAGAGRLAPGSKKPLPLSIVPVTITSTDACPIRTDAGLQLDGVAGGGAIILVILQPYKLVPTQYWLIIHIVMSSRGSTDT